MQTAMFEVIRDAWLAMLLVWVVTAFTTKRTTQAESNWTAYLRSGFMFAIIYGLYDSPPHSAFLRMRLVPQTLDWEFVGTALAVLGLGFSIWARFALGSNWSAKVTIKQDHQLIVRGPYRIVRNPIYTGIFFALVGTAIAAGQMRHFLVLPVVLAIWTWKISNEQRVLTQKFGDDYVRYCREVKAFIPYVI